MNFAQPDLTLHLDLEGVISNVEFANDIVGHDLSEWIGRPWADTVADVGSQKIDRMLEDARLRGVSAFRQINQKFPSGAELPMEYATVRLGRKGGLLAIGKSLAAVADLQSRLIAAQQAMEQDYWKLRDVETRYRLVFDASNDPIVLIRASNLHIVEANPAAMRALGLSSHTPNLLDELAPDEREPFQAMLYRVREHGKAPAILVRLAQKKDRWLVRASLMPGESGHIFMLQLTQVDSPKIASTSDVTVSINSFFDSAVDAMIVTDEEGIVQRANSAFLDLVQVGSGGSVVGERLGRWIEHPGADHSVLLATIRKNGPVRHFSTTIKGELGTPSAVEISAKPYNGDEPNHIGMVLREVGQRLPTAKMEKNLSLTVEALAEQVGKTPLRDLVKTTVDAVENHYIVAALQLTDGNRTAAAELLGLSRQSLYSKIHRFGLGNGDDRKKIS